ncbi:2-phytyl-1,4-beta-naphthoquinone methyltransferase, chloroplastic isoform X1 [Vitis vinifera]|uniref:2-phytyl-1,4-beta-naphthoquinone methyltransferase, chloroplastic isoform X1 n=1 Tax=Vitis vinifera TaxID=29760 RepID=UPI0008FEC9AC|nr:2-phytyl-1,4-beta-naphthoquinone methyltransferase, chloroplastic isoform X1 [Vitis vinifera]|eukprot:XP_019075613.1 PREDICTED: 2-phytyl-1,4-beta-naphthoquinone methyltransferase, chloroplastic isoform X1 [Vitis vinifera]
MASLQFLLRPSSNPNLLALPSRCRSVRCADERQALFNRIAPVYDNLNDFLSLGQHRIWKRMAVSWSGWIEGNAIELPFYDCSFDAITMRYGLRNVLAKCKAMQELF